MANNFFEVETPSHNVEMFKALTAHEDTTFSEGFGAAVKSGFRNNISAMLYDKIASESNELIFGADMLDAERANEIYTPEVKFTEPISRFDANLRKNREMFLREQEAIQTEAQMGGGSRFAGSLLGGLADPITALVSGGVGVIGGIASKSIITSGRSVKAANLLKGLSKTRLSSHIAKEIGESVVAAAIIEIPLAEDLESVYGENVGIKEHLFNIATGAAAGVVLRSMGRVFSGKSKPGAVDQETTADILIEETFDADSKGKAPDYEAALEKDRAEVAKKSSDPTSVESASKVVELEDAPDNIFMSTHPVGATDLVNDQIRYGSSFGDGVYMVNNPALADAKAGRVQSADVIKYDVTDLTLLDIDEPAPNAFKEFSKTELPPVITKAINQGSSLKTILEIVDDLQDASPESGIQSKVNGFLADLGYDGYRFKEDFFEGEHPVSDAVFILKDSEALQNSVKNRYTFDDSNRVETPKPEAPEIPPKDINTLVEEPQTEFPKDNPVYDDAQLEKVFRETFAKEEIGAPDTDSAELGEEVADLIESIVESDLEFEMDEESAIMKMAQDGKADLEQSEKVIKAAIACGKRNL